MKVIRHGPEPSQVVEQRKWAAMGPAIDLWNGYMKPQGVLGLLHVCVDPSLQR